MKYTLLLVPLVACANPTGPAPSLDCTSEKTWVRDSRGASDSTTLATSQTGDHPVVFHERWYYRGSPLVETFTWGGLLGQCVYDQENRPDWLMP